MTAMGKDAIVTSSLTKRFKMKAPDPNSVYDSMWLDYVRDLWRHRDEEYFAAVDGVSLKTPRGELFGLLGPNGAGKTTLLKLLSTLLRPDGGEAYVNGYSVQDQPDEVRASISIVTSAAWLSLDWQFNVRQNIEFWLSLYGYGREDASEKALKGLEVVGMLDRSEADTRTLSSGMRQRVALARGLALDAPVFLLDEPTAGLDPLAAQSFREFVTGELNTRLGRTVVLTTHITHEAERMCDRVAIMDKGRIVACGSLGELRTRAGGIQVAEFGVRGLTSERILDLKPDLGAHLSIVGVDADGAVRLRIALKEGQTTSTLAKILEDKGARVIHEREDDASLEEVFFMYTSGWPCR